MSAAPTFDGAVKAAIGAALAADPGRKVVTEDATAPFGVDHTLVVPVADRAALGLAFGLALGGCGVIVEGVGTGRLPALSELLAEIGAVAAARELAVPLLLRVPLGLEMEGLDQPAGRWLLDAPGVGVVAASSGEHAAAVIAAWSARPTPLVLLEPRALARDRANGHGDVDVHADVSDVGQGEGVALVASGAHLSLARAIAATDPRFVAVDLARWSPFPDEALGAVIRRLGRAVFVGDDVFLARRVRQAAVDGAFEYLESPLGTARPDPADVARAVRDSLSW